MQKNHLLISPWAPSREETPALTGSPALDMEGSATHLTPLTCRQRWETGVFWGQKRAS